MPLVTANFLARYTGKTWRTISRRIDKLPTDPKGKVDSIAALEAIYCGTTNGNGFISTPEAVRQLTIAKKAEIDLDMAIKGGEWIQIKECQKADNDIFTAIAGTIKANRNKVLTDALINEMFYALRTWAHRNDNRD